MSSVSSQWFPADDKPRRTRMTFYAGERERAMATWRVRVRLVDSARNYGVRASI